MRLSDRRALIDSSGIRKVFALAATLKDPCDLSIGIPDFDVPDPIKEVAIDAIRRGRNSYTPTPGIPPLRDAIRRRYARQGLDFPGAIVTSGTSGALYLIFLATLNPGDEVLIPDPYFVMYKHLLRFIGAKPVFLDTAPSFRLDRAALERAVTPNTRMLLLNSPSNPTGVVYSEAEARMVADFARERGLILVSDEIYDAYAYDAPFVSPARFNPETVVVSGLSKTVGMTGWRVGWVCGPTDLVQALEEIQQYTFVCSPSPAQWAAVEALDFDFEPIRASYRERRDLIYRGLIDTGYETTRPEGAFYIFPKAPGGDGDAFVKRAVERSLLMVPGSVFSERRDHFRICFAKSVAQLERGLGILKELRREFPA